MRFEYLVEDFHCSMASDVEARFNELGEKRWELVSVNWEEGRAIFKRTVDAQLGLSVLNAHIQNGGGLLDAPRGYY